MESQVLSGFDLHTVATKVDDDAFAQPLVVQCFDIVDGGRVELGYPIKRQETLRIDVSLFACVILDNSQQDQFAPVAVVDHDSVIRMDQLENVGEAGFKVAHRWRILLINNLPRPHSLIARKAALGGDNQPILRVIGDLN
ncbi:hypothetical protein [Rhodococcus sp. NJ-530]|uniref:hypothetical protein n=1 Tax=Rhodococcus sp. NJ-530 TaxID=2490853 RepID=UPI001F14FF24|nr:hypothetical protein [Rhodococcus sp. NJ-530]